MFESFKRQMIDVGEARINTLTAGRGAPLLLVHGYPQTHVMWHKIAPRLAEQFSVVCCDMRGYGDSSVPATTADHSSYAKRAVAADLVKVMEKLGHRTFMIAGHDRGGRVTHRLCLDHAEKVTRAAVLDIVPTPHMFATVNRASALGGWHWYFLAQPFDLPERLIGGDPEYYLNRLLDAAGDALTPEARAQYTRCFVQKERIHASCEDYRAAAHIDLEHHKADNGRKITCPLLAIWGERSVGRAHDPIKVWKEWADDVVGMALPCGHYVAEEAPRETFEAMRAFFSG
ncbi:MAG: alpha/beta hydrolase [Alphaproteobacteria bacterium]|nr:alpha/beta hydrolase [Alphaproteobacteria bacterium]MCW5739952.1 alpha/beta hydrolase [Alphaproteobacteria bacterium]